MPSLSFTPIMAFLQIIKPDPGIYMRTRLYGVGRAESAAEMRDNLRLIGCILMARWSDDPHMALDGQIGDLFDVMTSESFYQKGIAKTVENNDERLWFNTYAGFEMLTSQWAKENAEGCRGVICMRVHNQGTDHQPIDSHTIQIYF